LSVEVQPVGALQPLHLEERGELRDVRAEAIVANLSPDIGRRELQVVKAAFGLADSKLRLNDTPPAKGPGNALLIVQEYEHVTAVFTGFGERGVRAETVAARTVAAAQAFAASDAAADEHLADQLLLPLALAAAGSFTTVEPTGHTLTNIAVIEEFLSVRFATRRLRAGVWRIEVEQTGSD
jgi:RNA 3'-terminal phosphate cyclase (ATP)